MQSHGNSHRASVFFFLDMFPQSMFLHRIFAVPNRKGFGKYIFGGFDLAIYIFSRHADPFLGATQSGQRHFGGLTLWGQTRAARMLCRVAMVAQSDGSPLCAITFVRRSKV